MLPVTATIAAPTGVNNRAIYTIAKSMSIAIVDVSILLFRFYLCFSKFPLFNGQFFKKPYLCCYFKLVYFDKVRF
jgi:hypothetical protein